MAKVSNRVEKIRQKVELRNYKAIEALNLLKETATAKFNESAEVHISLKLDTKFADQQLRTTIILPKGTGKKVRVAVIADGDKIQQALDAGADIAGSQDLVQDIMKGMLDFDRLIATPDLMPSIAKLGKVLGPRGLMPSPKSGTVTTTLVNTILEFKKGKFEYKADKTGIVHVSFGKANFTILQLIENLTAIYKSIEQNRPSGVKGKYFKSLYICTTMGPSIQLDLAAFN
jgi:large subunit ribosomal protein L1